MEVTYEKKDDKGRCEKRVLSKCKTVFKSYDPIQSAYADILESNMNIAEIQCNILYHKIKGGAKYGEIHSLREAFQEGKAEDRSGPAADLGYVKPRYPKAG